MRYQVDPMALFKQRSLFGQSLFLNQYHKSRKSCHRAYDSCLWFLVLHCLCATFLHFANMTILQNYFIINRLRLSDVEKTVIEMEVYPLPCVYSWSVTLYIIHAKYLQPNE